VCCFDGYEQNVKYNSEEENYIVISETDKEYRQKVTMKFHDDEIGYVNIINIGKVIQLCKNEKKSNIEEVLKLIRKDNSNNIDFGMNVTLENIKKKINFQLIPEDEASEKDISTKLYWYLLTLDKIVGIIKEKNINHDMEKEWVFLLNSHGCLCSQDSQIYKKCPIKTRNFPDNRGKEHYFSLHLKPITYNIKSDLRDLTRRIYFKWEKNKVLIGWIGKHPVSCSNEPDPDCVKVNCKYRPRKE